MIATHKFCRSFKCTFMLWVSCSTIYYMCSVGFRSGNWESHWRTVNWLCSWNQLEMIFCAWTIFILDIVIRIWPYCGSEGHTWSVTKLKFAVASDNWLVLMGPIIAKKTHPSPLHHFHQPGDWIHAVGTKFWPYHLWASTEIKIHQARLNFSSLRFLYLADRSGTWSHGLLLLQLICLKIWCVVHSGRLFCSQQLYRVSELL